MEIFENRSNETGVENFFTNDLIYEIGRTRNVNVAGKDTADGILAGVITAITIETASWRGQNVAAERRVTAHVNLRLTDRRTGKLVWSAQDVGANETYPVADSNQQTERNKRDAIAVLSKRMAEGIYNRLTTDF